MNDKKVFRSGIIPYVIEENIIKMMFMIPSDSQYGGPLPQIAKGRIEENEDPLEAGLREASEELGLFTGNVLETHNLGTFLGRTTIHVVKIKDKALFGDPHFETQRVLWMTNEEFQKDGRDLHKPIVSAALRLIKDKEQ